jgi:hypothetical protein
VRLRTAGLVAGVVVLGVVVFRAPGPSAEAPIVPASAPVGLTTVTRAPAPRTCPRSLPLAPTVDFDEILERCGNPAAGR